VVRRPALGVAGLLRQFDSLVVDSTLLGLGRSTQGLSQVLKTVASGNAQYYGLLMASGVLALMVLVIFLR
jgi:hypothetical protein